MPIQSTSLLSKVSRLAAAVLLGSLAIVAASSCASVADRGPVAVNVIKTADDWSLERAGRPYIIHGAGGPGSLEALVQAGGNSTRVWGFDQLEDGRLDEALRHGLTVAVGIWLRHDLDYDDPQQVADQTKMALDGVRKYKNHPAVLLWGIGNEMEGGRGDNPAVWQHVETLAKRIKEEDPLHPTMTVLAEVGGEKIQHLHRLCPSIDIVGINSYGGAPSIPRRYRERGGTKPYIVTEFGPRGPWELPKNEIGTVVEELGHVKAATYEESHRALQSDRSLCLGSYAFMWGYKQEATPTWFGMFLADGRKTAAVDVMTRQWSGEPPKNLCPRIDALSLLGGTTVKAGAIVKAKLRAQDPEGQPLKVDWLLMADAKRHLTGGYHQDAPPSFADNVLEATNVGATFRAPNAPGVYRIFAYVGDGQNAADVANVPFRVEE